VCQLHREQQFPGRDGALGNAVLGKCVRRLRIAYRDLAVGDGRKHRWIVGDQQHRQTAHAALANQLTPSVATGGIQCSGWLVGYQQGGLLG
jgi:hypothetical protein